MEVLRDLSLNFAMPLRFNKTPLCYWKSCERTMRPNKRKYAVYIATPTSIKAIN